MSEKRDDDPGEAKGHLVGIGNPFPAAETTDGVSVDAKAVIYAGVDEHQAMKARARERELVALRLKKEGLSNAEIAEQLGVSTEGARKIIQRVFKKLTDATLEDAAEQRRYDLVRIDMLIEKLWPKAMQENLKHVDRIRLLLRDRSKLLGLDAPTRIQIDDALKENNPSMLKTSDLEKIVIDATLEVKAPDPGPVALLPEHPSNLGK